MKNEELNNDKKYLKDILEKANFKIFVVFNGVSRSGMLRRYSVYCFIPDSQGELRKWYLNYYVGRVSSVVTYDREKQNLKIRGCGMDMAYHLVTSLSYKLYEGDENKLKYELL